LEKKKKKEKNIKGGKEELISLTALYKFKGKYYRTIKFYSFCLSMTLLTMFHFTLWSSAHVSVTMTSNNIEGFT
jgi:hypothetical protein